MLNHICNQSCPSGQLFCLMYVAIGPAQCRHRPAGGQPFRDVAARTAGAEHPTTVFVGCGSCNKTPHSANTLAECLK